MAVIEPVLDLAIEAVLDLDFVRWRLDRLSEARTHGGLSRAEADEYRWLAAREVSLLDRLHM
jgi:hypothetical protein